MKTSVPVHPAADAAAPSPSTGPLEGIVIVDLTRVLSGPYATMLLGDLGATIIKVESPGAGDTTRHSAPFRNGQSHYFLSINRNKRSVAIDLSTEAGRELVRRLCAAADVLIENFRPGTLEAMGLAPERLWASNPALVVCSISGFGQDGPLRDRIAYDVITQAISGILSTNGEAGGAPVRLSIPIGDLTGGLLACIGIVSSLLGRSRGRGERRVDVSLHDGLISQLGYLATLYDVTGRAPERLGSRHPSIVPYGTYRTRDGFLALAIFTSRFWRKFCDAIGRPEVAEEPRFRRTSDRMANRVELESLVENVLRERTTAEWEETFSRADVPASAILGVPEAVEQAHTRARGMFPTLTHPAYGSIRVPGPPLRLGGEAVANPLAPPMLGEHTDEVLRDMLGLDDDELATLRARRVIGGEATVPGDSGSAGAARPAIPAGGVGA
ncbi:MAG: CaiB/BaiF CoA transferase family protein [Lautropia sp.]